MYSTLKFRPLSFCGAWVSVMSRLLRLAAVASLISVSAASNSTAHEVSITVDRKAVPFYRSFITSSSLRNLSPTSTFSPAISGGGGGGDGGGMITLSALRSLAVDALGRDLGGDKRRLSSQSARARARVKPRFHVTRTILFSPTRSGGAASSGFPVCFPRFLFPAQSSSTPTLASER